MMMAMMMMIIMVVRNDLSGEKDSPEVYKEDMGGGGGVAGPQDGDDVCDAQQGDDHLGMDEHHHHCHHGDYQQGLCRFPVLMISGLSTFTSCSQLRHNLEKSNSDQGSGHNVEDNENDYSGSMRMPTTVKMETRKNMLVARSRRTGPM